MNRRLGMLRYVLVSVALYSASATGQTVAPIAGSPWALPFSPFERCARWSFACPGRGRRLYAPRTPTAPSPLPPVRQRLIALTFANTPEFDQTVNVQPDGSSA